MFKTELQRNDFFLNLRNFLVRCLGIPYICGMKKLAVFASGSGSNAENLIRYFNIEHPELQVRVSLVAVNKPQAYVLERARNLGVPSFVFDKKAFYPCADEKPACFPVLEALQAANIDYIVLAGFLWLFPAYLIQAFPERIVNIHPALLPSYGGQGMYGMFVHQAVVAQGEEESGITIHLVDGAYDHGQNLFQARCRLDKGETPESLAQKIHLLEQAHFPPVVARWIGVKGPEITGTGL